MGPDQLDHLVDDLRKLVVELLPQETGQKRHALEQSLHIRVLGRPLEHVGERRMALGETRAQILQIREFFLVVKIEHVRNLLARTCAG